ncbi:hypothetical protein MASR2M64_03330 [Candidatus Cloacimonadota bacterium]
MYFMSTYTCNGLDEVIDILVKYAWPGNVRELENLIYRMVILYESQQIGSADLPDYMKFTLSHAHSLKRILEEVEQDYIQAVLASVNDNKTLAAIISGVDRKTLYDKLKVMAVQQT